MLFLFDFVHLSMVMVQKYLWLAAFEQYPLLALSDSLIGFTKSIFINDNSSFGHSYVNFIALNALFVLFMYGLMRAKHSSLTWILLLVTYTRIR